MTVVSLKRREKDGVKTLRRRHEGSGAARAVLFRESRPSISKGASCPRRETGHTFALLDARDIVQRLDVESRLQSESLGNRRHLPRTSLSQATTRDEVM